MNKGLMEQAWKYFNQAVENEQNNAMAKARMSLILACKRELEALGFKSIVESLTQKQWLDSIPPWMCPYAVAAKEAVAAVRDRVERASSVPLIAVTA